MSNVVYIGGFGNGRSSAEKVGSALEPYYENPFVFTFSEVMNDPSKAIRAMKGVDLITHSAGALILDEEINPDFAFLLNPPLPTGVMQLMLKTPLKQLRMSTPGICIHTAQDAKAVLDYSASSVAELASHPLRNFGNLKQIAEFDVVTAAIRAQTRGVNSGLVWTENDVYFNPSKTDLDCMRIGGLQYGILPGEHDEVVLRPAEFLAQVLGEPEPMQFAAYPMTS